MHVSFARLPSRASSASRSSRAQRSMRSSPDARRAALLSGSVVCVVALGLFAEAERYDWTETRDWLPDLLVGWTLAGLGLAAFALARPRGAALLLMLSGITWFLGNFYEAQPEWLASAVPLPELGVPGTARAPLTRLPDRPSTNASGRSRRRCRVDGGRPTCARPQRRLVPRIRTRCLLRSGSDRMASGARGGAARRQARPRCAGCAFSHRPF